MQIRVVADQPWDVQADVLVVPYVGEPAFSGPLDELDRRSGGELRELATFRELRTKRYGTALAAAGELPVRRILTVAAGDAASIDREVVVRVAAAAERRLGGRQVRTGRLLVDAARGRDRGRRSGRRRARGPRHRRGFVRTACDLPREGRARAADPRRADPRGRGRRRRCRRPFGRARPDHRGGRERDAATSRTARRTTSRPRSSRRKPGRWPSSTACGST